MKIDKNFPGLTQCTDGAYVLDSKLISPAEIIVDLDNRLIVTGRIEAATYIEANNSIESWEYIEASRFIKVCGNIEAGYEIIAGSYIEVHGNIEASVSIEAHNYIKADSNITVHGCIKAGYGITAGGSIETDDGINAGFGIKAGANISCGKRIFAGLDAQHTAENCTKTIQCAELRKGEICYGDLVITKPKCTNNAKKEDKKMKTIAIKRTLDGKEVTIELTDGELEKAFRTQEHNFRFADADQQMEFRFSGDEEWFKSIYGFSLEDACCEDSEHYVLEELVSGFEKSFDCNSPENDIWDEVINTVLTNHATHRVEKYSARCLLYEIVEDHPVFWNEIQAGTSLFEDAKKAMAAAKQAMENSFNNIHADRPVEANVKIWKHTLIGEDEDYEAEKHFIAMKRLSGKMESGKLILAD